MFDLATALHQRRQELGHALATLVSLRDAVDWHGDLSLGQWFQLYATTLAFEPSMVLELGRGYGNSTTAFTAAATRLPATRVVSVGYDGGEVWSKVTAPKLKPLVGDDFFDRLEVHHTDIREVDFGAIVGDAPRVLLWWDAHGDDLAWFVLGVLLPLLRDRDALVCVHDVADADHDSPSTEYERSDGLPNYWMQALVCPFDEIVPLFDFLSRNRVQYSTAQASFSAMKRDQGGAFEEIRDALGVIGGPALSDGGWMYFGLEHASVFPRYQRSSRDAHENRRSDRAATRIREGLSGFLRSQKTR